MPCAPFLLCCFSYLLLTNVVTNFSAGDYLPGRTSSIGRSDTVKSRSRAIRTFRSLAVGKLSSVQLEVEI